MLKFRQKVYLMAPWLGSCCCLRYPIQIHLTLNSLTGAITKRGPIEVSTAISATSCCYIVKRTTFFIGGR